MMNAKAKQWIARVLKRTIPAPEEPDPFEEASMPSMIL